MIFQKQNTNSFLLKRVANSPTGRKQTAEKRQMWHLIWSWAEIRAERRLLSSDLFHRNAGGCRFCSRVCLFVEVLRCRSHKIQRRICVCVCVSLCLLAACVLNYTSVCSCSHVKRLCTNKGEQNELGAPVTAGQKAALLTFDPQRWVQAAGKLMCDSVAQLQGCEVRGGSRRGGRWWCFISSGLALNSTEQRTIKLIGVDVCAESRLTDVAEVNISIKSKHLLVGFRLLVHHKFKNEFWILKKPDACSFNVAPLLPLVFYPCTNKTIIIIENNKKKKIGVLDLMPLLKKKKIQTWADNICFFFFFFS